MAVDFQSIANRVAEAYRRNTERAVEDIKSSLSKPYPPASQPGQAPHRRNGFLRDNTKGESGRNGLRITAKLTNTAYFADDLENGESYRSAQVRSYRHKVKPALTSRFGAAKQLLPRPFMRPGANRMKARLVADLRTMFTLG